MVKIDAAIKRWVPSLIKPGYWNDVTKIKLEAESRKIALDILKVGKEQKLFLKKNHKSLA